LATRRFSPALCLKEANDLSRNGWRKLQLQVEHARTGVIAMYAGAHRHGYSKPRQPSQHRAHAAYVRQRTEFPSSAEQSRRQYMNCGSGKRHPQSETISMHPSATLENVDSRLIVATPESTAESNR